MFISKHGFDIGTVLSVINSSNLEVAANSEAEHMIKYLTNGNNKITKKEIINYMTKAYPLLSRFSQIEIPITVMDYKMILKEFDSSYLYFHKIPQMIDSSINKLNEANEPMDRISFLKAMAEYDKKASEYGKNSLIEDMSKKEKVETEQQTFDVLAVSCDKPFVVASENVEELKNTKANPKVIKQTEEMEEEFRVNNLGPVLKKIKKQINRLIKLERYGNLLNWWTRFISS